MGYATTTDNSYNVWINPYKIYKVSTNYTYGSDGFKISNVEVDGSVFILFHELLHIMGVGLANLWFNNLVFTENSELVDLQPEDASLNYFASNREEHTSNIIGYTGYNGLTQYKNMLLNYGFSVANIDYLPIENSGYSGSALMHPEEGYSRNASNEKIREYIYIDGQHYPVIQDDIISATIDLSLIHI